MNKNLLQLEPTRWLCPFCGQWHDWTGSFSLGSGFSHLILSTCPYHPKDKLLWTYFLDFKDDDCHYNIMGRCRYGGRPPTFGKIPISSITQSKREPIISFKAKINIGSFDGEEVRKDCPATCLFRDNCTLLKIVEANGYKEEIITPSKHKWKYVEMELKFEFEKSQYEKATGIRLKG